MNAAPPLVIRLSNNNHSAEFTNTSENILHGITLHKTVGGTDFSCVVIPTIKPHESVTMEESRSTSDFFEKNPDATIFVTCLHYSKPIPLGFRWFPKTPAEPITPVLRKVENRGQSLVIASEGENCNLWHADLQNDSGSR